MLDADQQQEIFEDVLSAVNEMCEQLMTEPDDDLPAVALLIDPSNGLGLVPIAHMLDSEMHARAVANIMLPRVVKQTGAEGVGVVLTVWKDPTGFEDDEREVRAVKQAAETGRAEAVVVMLGFADSMMWHAERDITRVPGASPELGDWDVLHPVEWMGESGVLLDSAMAALTGRMLLTTEAVDFLAAQLAQNDTITAELQRHLEEQGFGLDDLSQIIEDGGDPPPEFEMAMMTVPEELRDRIVALAQEHMPEHGDIEFQSALREWHEERRAPYRGVARYVFERMNR